MRAKMNRGVAQEKLLIFTQYHKLQDNLIQEKNLMTIEKCFRNPFICLLKV